jgi:hypothetical protein
LFLLIRNAGQSGELWPVAAARIGKLAVVLLAAAALRRSLLPGPAGRRPPLLLAAAGAIDVVANICYVEATRTGRFGLAVVLVSLYPGVTVLLARASSVSGYAGSSGSAWASQRSASCSSQHERSRHECPDAAGLGCGTWRPVSRRLPVPYQMAFAAAA